MTIACIGECMVELREQPDGRLTRGFGGDTLNTAVYLARLGVDVEYVTALGDDEWSAAMLVGWQAEGVGVREVRRLPGKLPGLYVIQTDAAGERRFSYWRDSAAARALFDGPEADALLDRLLAYDVLYVSGITLSIYAEPARARLMAMLERAPRVVFDTNFRPRGWPDRDVARALYRRMFALSDIVLASIEDLEPLFGGEAALLDARRGRETVLKLPAATARVLAVGMDRTIGTALREPVDTTAAGDSFAAAYLAARLRGAAPDAAARAGHRLAGAVIAHSGAIIPRSAMPAGELP